MGVTEPGNMFVSDPNIALSVLYGLGTWEPGSSAGGGGDGTTAQGLDERGRGGGQQQQRH